MENSEPPKPIENPRLRKKQKEEEDIIRVNLKK